MYGTIVFENQIGPPYFRAVAKIAFHGALRIIAGIGDGVILKDRGHVVAVETTPTTVFAKLQFFIGPGVPPMWVVRMGTSVK